jgi:hypothetical protein
MIEMVEILEMVVAVVAATPIERVALVAIISRLKEATKVLPRNVSLHSPVPSPSRSPRTR